MDGDAAERPIAEPRRERVGRARRPRARSHPCDLIDEHLATIVRRRGEEAAKDGKLGGGSVGVLVQLDSHRAAVDLRLETLENPRAHLGRISPLISPG